MPRAAGFRGRLIRPLCVLGRGPATEEKAFWKTEGPQSRVWPRRTADWSGRDSGWEQPEAERRTDASTRPEGWGLGDIAALRMICAFNGGLSGKGF